MQNLDVLRLEGLFLLSTPLRVSRQGISSSVSIALTIVDLEVVTRELLGPADLSGAQTLCLHEPAEVVVVGGIVQAPYAKTLLGSASKS